MPDSSVTLEITGMDELLKKLTRLGERVPDILGTALTSGAALFQNRWKQIAPYKTGTYRGSIYTETLQTRGQDVAVAVGTDITDPPYPFFLEYGTSRMPLPHPSMRPALDETRDAIIAEVRHVIEQQIERP